MDEWEFLLKGSSISKRDVSRLTRAVHDDPDDLKSRALLLGFFDRYSSRHEDYQDIYAEHLIWFVREHPGSELFEWLCPLLGKRHFLRVKREWLEQVRRHQDDPKVLHNAAAFCEWGSRGTAEKLWMRAHELEPTNDEFPRRLSRLFEQWSRVTGDRRHARKAVRFAIQALDINNANPRDSYLTTYVEMITSELGNLMIDLKFPDLAAKIGARIVQAEHWPVRLVQEDGSEFTTTVRRLAPHYGHSILGQALILQDHVDAAAAELENMIEYPKPVRPDLRLAGMLLKNRKSEVVEGYLESCALSFSKRLDDLERAARLARRHNESTALVSDNLGELQRRKEQAADWIATLKRRKRLRMAGFHW